jgi:hypothetical protein
VSAVLLESHAQQFFDLRFFRVSANLAANLIDHEEMRPRVNRKAHPLHEVRNWKRIAALCLPLFSPEPLSMPSDLLDTGRRVQI